MRAQADVGSVRCNNDRILPTDIVDIMANRAVEPLGTSDHTRWTRTLDKVRKMAHDNNSDNLYIPTNVSMNQARERKQKGTTAVRRYGEQ